MTYREALRALNQAAYAAARACPNETEKRQLKQMCFAIDTLVDAQPSQLVPEIPPTRPYAMEAAE
jgi:hypothetical protein